MWPEGRIAERSLIETPITLPPLPDIFNSSPSVDCSIRRGDDPGPSPPSRRVESSETLVTRARVVVSHHSFPTIPLIDGVAPVRKVECPIAVTVGICSNRAFVKKAP